MAHRFGFMHSLHTHAKFVGLALTACALGLAATPALAQTKYTNDYLNIGVGARSLAMGNTATAFADDATAGYYNPARLPKAWARREVQLMHNEYFLGGANYDYIGLAARIDERNAVSVNALRFATDNIANTLRLIDPTGVVNYNNITTFSAADYGFLLSYGRILTEKFSVGATGKVLHRSVGPFGKAWGFGLDAALSYTPTSRLQVGLNLRDVFGTYTNWVYETEQLREAFVATGNQIPTNRTEVARPSAIAALAYKQPIGTNISIMGTTALEATIDGQRNTLISSSAVSIDPRFGLEAAYKNVFLLRGGLSGIQKYQTLEGDKRTDMRPSVGVGIRYRGLRVDYALADLGQAADGRFSHVIGLALGIGVVKPEGGTQE